MKMMNLHTNLLRSFTTAASSLIGPPEIYKVAAFNPIKGYTENRSPTYLSSGNPCLDFFFHVVLDTPPESVTDRLKLAWDQDPLTALKLVCNLRGAKGTGKADKEGFYTAALWLHGHHPKTLAANVAAFADFGYFKDLLEILFRLLEGADARKLEKEMGAKWLSMPKGRRFLENTDTPEVKRIKRAKRVVERFNQDPNFKLFHESVSDLLAEKLR